MLGAEGVTSAESYLNSVATVAVSFFVIQVDLDKERKLPLSDKQYNACFYGNPGGS